MTERSGSRQMLNVMIVDDEMIVREDVRAIMDWESHDYRIVAEAEDGLEACRLCESTHIDIIIADIQMPVMNGLDMASRILETNKQIRFIFLTAFDDFEFLRTSMRLGINSYILKHEIDEETLCSELDKQREALLRESQPASSEASETDDLPISPEYLRVSEHFETVCQYVQKNYRTDISLEDMASRFHISESYLSHLFTRELGMSFKSYLKQIRMEKAREQLLRGEIRIADLARNSGYSSSQYFFQVFKQYYKMTPTEYLRRYGREK